MSIYFQKNRGWKYDFTHKRVRHASGYFKTKTEAKRNEAQKKEELRNPPQAETIQTDMAFLDMVNTRLDYVKAYNSESHYRNYVYMAKRWIFRWGGLMCSQITQDMIQKFVLLRNRISPNTANKEIRYLRATFNFALKRKLFNANPVDGIDFLPTEKKVKYVPSVNDIEKVISVADQDTRDYLITIADTMARMGEVNQLVWDDIKLTEKCIILYTRKKKGGHLTPRTVPMTRRLYEIMQNRFEKREKDMPWVFWHTYWSRKEGQMKSGPFKERKRIMKALCKKAEVRYFRFHALRHSGASVLDSCNVPIGAIQRILGHENRKTTEIYIHGINKTEHEAIAAFEHARGKSHTQIHTQNPNGHIHEMAKPL